MRNITKPSPLAGSVLSLIMILCLMFSTGCSKKVVISQPKKKPTTTTQTQSKPLPPGQAKKVNGDKSAKSYAPGQQKKKQK